MTQCEAIQFDPSVDARKVHGLEKLRAVEDDATREVLRKLYDLAVANDVRDATQAKQLSLRWTR